MMRSPVMSSLTMRSPTITPMFTVEFNRIFISRWNYKRSHHHIGALHRQHIRLN
jgi:hypothetical protein